MTTLYVTEPFSIVKKDGETLVIQIPKSREGKPARKVRVPLQKVSQVIVQGDSTVTTPALNALMEQNTDVCFLSYYGKFKGRMLPADSKNGLLRLAQHRIHNDGAWAFWLATRFVGAKLRNMRTLLMRTNRKRQSERVSHAIKDMQHIVQQVGAIDTFIPPPNPSKPQKDSSIGHLMGLEGAGSAAYFGVYGDLLQDDWGFVGRNRRPPRDPVNALLSYGYTLLMNYTVSACHIVGFDPYIGYLHSTQYGKPALALDIMEEFRAPIVDSVVLKVLNSHIITHDDFEENFGAYQLKDEARRTFIRQFEDRMQTEIKHPVFEYQASYQRCIELQARLLSRWLLDDIPEYIPLVTR